MVKNEIEAPLLDGDIESHGVGGRISRINENYGAIPEVGGAHVSDKEYAVHRRRNSVSAVLVLSICCIAAILCVSAGVVTYNSSKMQPQHRTQIQIPGEGNKFGLQGGPNGNSADNDFYRASRSTFHFQPERNWMNDPNAPLFYGGYYHFFYQYNPDGAIFGNMTWGHAVSTDLIHWMHLEVALYPDQWYDNNGCWSGSATILRDGTPAIIYTGGSIDENGNVIQSQALALPVDPRDPLLRKWYKPDSNPIIMPPSGFKTDDFRDPTTGWLEDDGFWRLTIGSKKDNSDGTKDGMALLYKSIDFINWELEDHYLHDVPGTGMWECVDFFPVTTRPKHQIDNEITEDDKDSEKLKARNEFSVERHAAVSAENYITDFKYVLKASLDTWAHDHYTIGTYSLETQKFIVDDPALELGKGHRYDYGKFYASKTFYDSSTGRRILWSWVNESDSQQDDIIKGWASLQAIPRTVWLDGMTQTNLLTWPVEEVDALRGSKTNLQNVVLYDGDVVKVEGGDGPQLDVIISFEKPDVSTVRNVIPEHFDCSQGGSAHKGIFGPFGVLVHTDDAQIEQTAVFFYLSPMENGQWSTRVCSDQSRSSLAQNLDETVYGSYVTVLPTENEITMRILVDHSIVETFAMGGRMAITSRVYPTKALNEDSHLFLFNNGTTPVKVNNLDVFQMSDVHMIAI